jgi:hypothetical protein
MQRNKPAPVLIKSVESRSEGYKIELLREGDTYRVNVSDGPHPRTRVFASYPEADSYYSATVQGN